MLEEIHARIQFCDKKFSVRTINLFKSLSNQIRNEKLFVKFLSLCETYLIEKFNFM